MVVECSQRDGWMVVWSMVLEMEQGEMYRREWNKDWKQRMHAI